MGGLIGKITGADEVKKGGRRAEQLAAFQDFGINTPLGTAGITEQGITASGAPGTSLIPGFEQLAQQRLTQAQGAPSGLFSALDPNAAFAQALGIGGAGQAAGADFLSQAQGLTAGLAGFDRGAFEQEQFDRLNQLASRGEETAASSLANRLFASGRLGGRDTATSNAFEGLERGQLDARTQRALQAIGLGQSELQSRIGAAGGLVQAGLGAQGISQGQLAQQFLQSIGAGGQVAGIQQAGAGNLLQGALGGTQGISQAALPTNQSIQNLLAGSGLLQSARANQAGIAQQTGQQAGAATGALTGGLLSGVVQRFAGA